MESIAALLVPLLFGGLFLSTLSDDDEDDDTPPAPEPQPEPEPEPQPEPEDGPTRLGPDDGDYTGSDGDDLISATGGYSGRVEGADGDDTLSGINAGSDAVHPDSWTESLSVSWAVRGSDWVVPPETPDGVLSLLGGDGDDHITARGEDIFVNGNGGADTLDLRGMTGGIVRVGAGDSVLAPVGVDTDVRWLAFEGAKLDLGAAGDGQTVYVKGADAEVIGSGRNDVMITEGGGDTLSGGAGNDVLQGNHDSYAYASTHTFPFDAYVGTGNDVLNGGAGADSITGDLADTLTGGEGADTFEAWVGPDTVLHVTDFDPAQDSLNVMTDGEFDTPRVITAAEVDGNTIIRCDGADVMVIEGRTGLNIGINQDTSDVYVPEPVYLDPNGNQVDPATVDVKIERYMPIY